MNIPTNAIRILLAAGIGAAAFAALPARADDDRPGPGVIGHDRAYQFAREAGLRDIEEIEFDDGRYEVEGRDDRGREVELKLHPRTGAVMHREVDDDRWDD